jgi:hypothetical protein
MCVKRITYLIICLLMIGLFAIQAEAARKNKIKSTLYSIDVSAHTVTLKDLNGALTTLRIISQLKTKRDEMKASLTDLALGDQVVCSQMGNLSPRKLKAAGPKVAMLRVFTQAQR